MEVKILGIVDNLMIIAPFYGGDHSHKFPITNYQKSDLLERGVKEYPSYDYIEAMLYNKSYKEYLQMMESLRTLQKTI